MAGVRISESTYVEYDEGIRIINDVAYEKGKKIQDFNRQCELLKRKSEFEQLDKFMRAEDECSGECGEYKFEITYDLIKAIPIDSFNYSYYHHDSKLPLTIEEAREIVLSFHKDISADNLEKIMKYIHLYNALDHIPKFVIPTVDKQEIDFRFCKSAYQLIKYYLFEEKDKYMFTIMSNGNMGKSTFTNFLKYLFNKEYFSANLSQLNRFSAASFAGKRLVTFSDCTSERIQHSDMLKQIIGGDGLELEQKGIQSRYGNVDCHLLFVGNEDLCYDCLDSGLDNRFINIEWESTFDPKLRDNKWREYQWTPSEIAFQIEIAREIEPMNYEELQTKTIKKALSLNGTFKYVSETFNVYNDPGTRIKYKYNENNFYRYVEKVMKYFSYEEWYSLNQKTEDFNAKVKLWTGE